MKPTVTRRFIAAILTLLASGWAQLAVSQEIGGPADEFALHFRVAFDDQNSSFCLRFVSEQETLETVLAPSSLTVTDTSKVWRRKKEIKWQVLVGQPVTVAVQCRKTELAVAVRDRIAGVFPRKPGKCSVRVGAAAGASVEDVRFQPCEPVVFSDDFMRTEETSATGWTAAGGRWQLAKAQQIAYAASPFRLQAVGDKPALYLAGHSFWRDYLFQASLRIAAPQASAGPAFYRNRDGFGFLFRWNGPSARFELVREGPQGEQVLAQSAGGLHSRQWYRLSVAVCGREARCFVDETEVLRASSDEFLEGGICLCASPAGGPVDFDDVLVRGLPFAPDEFRKLPTDGLVSWMRSVQPQTEVVNPTFQQDRYMKNWASAAAGWYREDENGKPVYRHHGRHYAGFELRIPLQALAKGKPKSFRLPGCVLTYQATSGDLAFSLAAAGKPLGSFTVPVSANALKVAWTPRKTEVGLEGKRLLEVPSPTYPEPVVAVEGEVEDFFWGSVDVRSAAKHGYTFYTAPSDWWATTGVWEAYSRWSCRPEWSLFGGLDDQMALIWNKRRFPGDVCLDAYVANPMVTMRPPFYAETSLNLTICGDGVHPFSGYSVVMGGWNRPVTRLFRQERLVAETGQALIPVKDPSLYHREWFHLQLAREGSRVLFLFQGKKALEFQDARPLEGDRLGLWALEYGISVGRAQIFYSKESSMWTSLEPPPPAETVPEGWRSLDGPHGAQLSEHEEKGRRFVRLTNPNPGGTFAASPPGCPFDARTKPLVGFSYRLQPSVLANLYFRKGEDWHLLQFTGPSTARRPVNLLGQVPGVQADGRWHSVEFDLLPALLEAYPGAGEIRVEEARIGLFDASDLHGAGLGGNAAGAFWDIADFAVRAGQQQPRWTTPESEPFSDDFESGLGCWERFGGPEGAYLFRDLSTRAGGKASLQLYKETHGGVFGARWKVTPFHLEEHPVLRFDYRMPHQVRAGLLVQVGGGWLSFVFSPDGKTKRWNQLVHVVQRDDQWHHTELNLLEAFKTSFPDAKDLWVNDLLFADQAEASLNGYAGNWWGNRYWLDNVELVASGKKADGPRPQTPDPRPEAPLVSVIYPDRLFLHSFETGPMPWRDWCDGPVVFSPGGLGQRCARIFGYRPAAYLSTMLWEDWIDLNRHPILRFDYRIPPDAAIGFAFNLEEFFYELPFSKAVELEKLRPDRREECVTGLVPGCKADDQWHSIEIDLLGLLKQRFPGRTEFRVRDLRTQQMGSQNPLGVSCYFDNVSIHSRRPGEVQIVWQTPRGTAAHSFCLDSAPQTVPDEVPEPGEPSATFKLGPGLHFFHLRTRSEAGIWGQPVHVPVRLEKD